MKHVLHGLLKGGRYTIGHELRDGPLLKVLLEDEMGGRDILPTKKLVVGSFSLPTPAYFQGECVTLISVVDVDVATRYGYATKHVGDFVVVFGVLEWGFDAPKEEKIDDGGAEAGYGSVIQFSFRRG